MRTYLFLLLPLLALAACETPDSPAAGGSGWVYAPSGAGSAARGGSVVSRSEIAASAGPGTILR